MLRHYFLNAVRSLRYCALMLSLWIGVAHAAPFAYIPNSGSNDVSVIDIATNTVVATVPVGTNPQGVAVNPAGTRVYVANFGSNNVSVINTATNTVVATVLVGTNPWGVAINPAGTRVYVTNQSSTISVIDATSNTLLATVPVDASPFAIVVNPAGTRVYVTARSSLGFTGCCSALVVIDTATNAVVARVGMLGTSPTGVAVNAVGTRAYVAYGQILVLDTASNTGIATVPMGFSARSVAINPTGTRAYVTNDYSTTNTHTVSVIDTASNTVVATVAVGTNPQGIAIDPTGTRAYVANYGSNNVSVIDTASNTVVATIAVGTRPSAFGLFISGPPPVCYTAPSATSSGSVNACFTGGGPTCSYSAPQFIGAPPGVAPVPPTTPGAGIVFPHGLFDFSTSGCLAGNTLSFSITYPAALPPGTQYWKYGPTAANTTPHWYVLPATISGNTATFSITDGGLGDDDLVANGTIVDQGGPGAGSSSNSVPTLSEWTMVLLVLLVLSTVAARRYALRNDKY